MEKIIILALIGVIFIVLLKEQKLALSFFLTLAVCILLMSFFLEYVQIMLEGLKVFENYFDSSGYYIKLILKMIGITYLCEFGTQICKDVGQGAIAGQIEILGKVMALIAGLPIVFAILEQIINFGGQ